MDRNLRLIVSCCFVLFYSASALTDTRLLHGRSSGATGPQTSLRTHGEVLHPRSFAMKQQESAQAEVRTRPVAVKCHPDSMEVVVQADVFDTSLKVDGAHLRLGSDLLSERKECGAVQSGEEEFTILTRLTDCGTKLSSTEEKIIYSNVLIYSPEPSSDGLLRLSDAAIPVECHYEKRYSVDAISLLPAWVPYVSTASEEDQIDFNLRIMTDDWQLERGSYVFFLGDPINFEVSVVMGNHMPLRVYVDHCVATATPDADAALRYDFIEHHGCLADAYLTNSNSRFLPRAEEHKLRFQLQAFRFYQEPSNQVYITCYIKAVPVTLPVSAQNRACSLIENRWQSVDGSDQLCRSCDISQRFEVPQTEPPKPLTRTESWPPMTAQQSLVQNLAEHPSATYVRLRPGMHKGQYIRPQEPSGRLGRRDVSNQEQKTIHLGPLVVLPSRNRKATESKDLLSQRASPLESQDA